MRDFDLSPLYRSAIGFDRLASMLDNATRNEQSQPAYPPYNIELIDDNRYRITMAVAGFGNDELSIQSEQGMLVIVGKKQQENGDRKYLYQGIAARSFERRFQLADHVKVVRASLDNGLLHVDLEREIPEAMKPRVIEIEGIN
ncbi:heat-shock protein IbpA [Marinobacterium nitratireducens]|uniref:Heat-shock protein IbpA n=1 Tax=Marinobacterium nitratireducens TaxID=518897 RepID=A0A917Z8U8_9GAMM|nr:Hsp20 family protein [Marinobacterium nitratireducens]GGO76101.1 heat-shock protein IbpA [Marinobacterium nitratireducens]